MRELRPLWIGLLAAFAGCVPGEVGDPCGSRGLGECGGDQYCSYPESAACGEADAPGACAPVPEVCTREYRPVCGCDGETYDNPCVAASAGASVRSQGACDDDGGTFCGGFAGIQCPADQFCNFAPETQCGSGNQGGVCANKPEACAEIYQPVCGCDDKTYGNACEAASAGVSVLRNGECTGATCAGLLGAQCPDGQFCSYAPEALCGAADQTGTCAPKPEACTFEYNPVCGCDDKTYGNACAAASAGVSVVSRGECAP